MGRSADGVVVVLCRRGQLSCQLTKASRVASRRRTNVAELSAFVLGPGSALAVSARAMSAASRRREANTRSLAQRVEALRRRHGCDKGNPRTESCVY